MLLLAAKLYYFTETTKKNYLFVTSLYPFLRFLPKYRPIFAVFLLNIWKLFEKNVYLQRYYGQVYE